MSSSTIQHASAVGAEHLTIAVVSDLHFFSKQLAINEAPSWLSLSGSPSLQLTNVNNPWSGLEELLQSNGLRADLLLCPGDITTWADPAALKVAWNNLIDLGSKLGCEVVAAATGNHDVSSRPPEKSERSTTIRALDHPVDLFEALKKLTPTYPIHDLNNNGFAHERRVHYFGADYVIHDSDSRYRVIVFNSCGRHTTESDTYERGRAAESTLEWLEQDLKSLRGTSEKINILVCHHHPMQHEVHGSYDFMQNGERLLSLMTDCGDWIVFHGHKHNPRLGYGPNSAASPVVFSAGSLGATPKALAAGAQNQFYLVDIALNTSTPGLRGTVRVWNWTSGNGWRIAADKENGIYHGCGFGERTHPATIAKAISQAFIEPKFPWEQLMTEIPYLKHVTPGDLKLVYRYLEDSHGLCIQSGIVDQDLYLTRKHA